MKTITDRKFHSDFQTMLESVIRSDEPIIISSDSGNTVLLSENLYRSLMATLDIYSTPGLAEKIEEGIRTPISKCIPSNDAEAFPEKQ